VTTWPKRVLVNLSGGIDSAYCLYLALQAGCDVLAHHIVLKNHEGRQDVERRATYDILAWMESQRLPGRITYVESGFDYGSLGYVVRDLNVWSFLTGVILANPRHRDRAVVISSHLDSPFMTDPVRDQRRRDLVRAVCTVEPEWVYPIGHMTKAQVVQVCPPDLLQLCWWCRRPENGRPCHRCHTCQQVDAALEAMNMLEARVIHPFRCKLTKQQFRRGDIYRHPSEARMVELASLEIPRIEWPPKGAPEASAESATEPKHVGGGWYELPDGRRIRGKDAAFAALREG